MSPTFLTALDIDNLARQGKRTLDLKPDARLTPLAWDRVRELGIELREQKQGGPQTPPGYTYPPASEAHHAFVQGLRALRSQVSPAPVLARLVDSVIIAAEGGPAVTLPSHLQLAAHGFSWMKRRELSNSLRILILWAPRLFGPQAAHRRYDILWALLELERCLSNPS